MKHGLSRRAFVSTALAALSSPALGQPKCAGGDAASDVTFIVTSDTHACLTGSGLAPKCQIEGKTDESLRHQIHAINDIVNYDWPQTLNSGPLTLVSGGRPIGRPRGVIVAGDLTDDGGGQIALPGEGTQLQQFSHRYQEGPGRDQIHFPVYLGLGNHDLDQDGPAEHRDWYRREMRDYVEFNHRPSVFFKPLLPATDFDIYSDNYSWDWGDLHLVQAQRFAGDSTKGAVDSLPWLRQDLEAYAGDGRPVILFQHYGWDPFSTGNWDPVNHRFDPEGKGKAQWWTAAQREALLAVLADFNVIAIFHGHQHLQNLAYKVSGIDVFSARAAFLGGFAVVRVAECFMDMAFAQAGAEGTVRFTGAFSKAIERGRKT